MKRIDIINKVGRDYLTSNVEKDEFNYSRELRIPMKGHVTVDIRSEHKNLSLLIETKK